MKGRVTERRLAALEMRAGAGRTEIVGLREWDWTKEDLARAVAEARERVGPGGMVISIEYVDDWQGTEKRTGRFER